MEQATGGYRGVWRRLRRNPIGMIGLTMLVTAIVVALLAPWLSPYDPPSSPSPSAVYSVSRLAFWAGASKAY